MDVEVSAVAGTASPESDGAVRMVKIDCDSLTGYAPIMPDGSFDATLGNLKTSDGSQSVDLRSKLSSGVTVTVSYTSMYGGTAETATMELPDVPVTDHLALKAESGGLHLIAANGFGDPDVDFYLYDADAKQNGSGEVLVETQTDGNGSFDADLSDSGLLVGDVLFYTLGKTDVEQTSSITMTFDRALSYIPAVITREQPDPPAGTVGTVTLEVSNDPDQQLTPGTKIDCTLEQTNNRVLTLTPTSNLKAGVTYQLTLKNLVNYANIAMAEGSTITTRFTVHGGDIIGNAHYGEVFDMVRRGVYLYIAAGKEGFDILDSSDPTDLHSAINGPVRTLGRARGVAIASGVSIPEDGGSNPRTVAVITSGGSGGEAGRVELRYADEQGTDGQSAGMGEFISGALLCNSFGSGTNGGEPTVVKTMGTTAFVSTIGVGMQEVDLNKVAEQNTNAVMFTQSSYPAPTSTWDIAMGIGGLGILPPSGGNHGFVIGAVRHKGMVAWDVTGGQTGPQPAGMEAFPAGVSNTSGNMRLAVYPNYTYSKVVDGNPDTRTTDLMLVAGGWAGLLIYQLTPYSSSSSSSSLGITLKTVVKLASSPYDVTVDEQRHIAYVACYDSGVAVVDLSDPYGGKLDADGNGIDDRIMGYLDMNTYSRAAIVVDSETGLIFTGEGGEKSGVFAVGAQKPKLQFLLDDPQHPGRYQVPGYLSAFQGDQPRLGLWVPGGQGPYINATLQLYDRKGFEETRQVIGQNQDGSDILAPVSTVYRTVTLTRQSNKKTDAKYNFYIQRNQSPPDVVKLGMLYDPNDSNAANMMISKQSGSLKGEVYLSFAHNPGSWCGSSSLSQSGSWDSFVSVRTPVSRPWVEWKSDTLVEENATQNMANPSVSSKSSSDAKSASFVDYYGTLPTDYYGPTHLVKDQKRDAVFWLGEEEADAFVTFAVSDSNVTLSGIENPLKVPKFGRFIKFGIKGTSITTDPKNPTIIAIQVRHEGEVEAKTIYKIPVWVFRTELAVDYNRDGVIRFTDETSPDTIPAGHFYEFWANDDHEGTVGQGTENDLPGNWSGNIIEGKRDLEDFTRLWLRTFNPNLDAANPYRYYENLHYHVSVESVDGSECLFDILPAADSDGGMGYLKDPAIAQAQVNLKWADARVALQSPSWNYPYSELQVWPDDNEVAHFIFCGHRPGKAKLIIEAFSNGVKIARLKLPVWMRPIEDYYDEFVCGDTNDDPNGPINSTCWPPLREATATDSTNDNYILYVHGWNMGEGDNNIWQKKRWAETAFKRLWWQGYRGHFGLFRWPSFNLDLNLSGYNNSTYNAFRSGAALKDLLVHLKTEGYKVNVLAHSQGNIVVAEALHEAMEDSSVSPPLINSYIASQAAISTSFYSFSSQYDFFTSKGITRKDRPDLPAHFVNSDTGMGCDDPSAEPYMQGTHPYARYWYNFYNNDDYAVGDHSSFLYEDLPNMNYLSAWEWNEVHFRPWAGLIAGSSVGSKQYGYDPQLGRFLELTCVSPYQWSERTMIPANRDDRFKIFSYALQQKGWTVGSKGMAKTDWYWNAQIDVNGVKYHYGDVHFGHDGQFMYSISERWHYWSTVLKLLGLQHWEF